MLKPELLIRAMEMHEQLFGPGTPIPLSPELAAAAAKLDLSEPTEKVNEFLIFSTDEEGGKLDDGIWTSDLNFTSRPYTDRDQSVGFPDWTKWEHVGAIRIWFDESYTRHAEAVEI